MNYTIAKAEPNTSRSESLAGFRYEAILQPLLRVELDARIIGDVDPHVDVRCAAEMPHERRAFQSPVVPDLILADVVIGEECQVTSVQASLALQALQRLLLIGLAEGFDQFL